MNHLRPLLEYLHYAARHPAIKVALAGLLILLVASGIAFGYWWPAYREQQALVAQVETQRRAAVEAMRAVEIARAYRDAKSATEAQERKLNASAGQADLVKSIERLAVKRGVRIVSQAFEEAKAKSEYASLHLDIGLQANYSSLRGFLSDLHGLPVWVEVQEVSLERSREHSGTIKAGLRLLTYRRMPNRTLALAP